MAPKNKSNSKILQIFFFFYYYKIIMGGGGVSGELWNSPKNKYDN